MRSPLVSRGLPWLGTGIKTPTLKRSTQHVVCRMGIYPAIGVTFCQQSVHRVVILIPIVTGVADEAFLDRHDPALRGTITNWTKIMGRTFTCSAVHMKPFSNCVVWCGVVWCGYLFTFLPFTFYLFTFLPFTFLPFYLFTFLPFYLFTSLPFYLFAFLPFVFFLPF